MKAEQSKFLSSMNSATDDVSNSGAEVDSDGAQNLEGSMQDVCSLCHDPNSKNPVSFLVLLQVKLPLCRSAFIGYTCILDN